MKSYEVDMINGPVMGKIARYCVPLAISGMLQLGFNAADIIIAGRYVGSSALAAVGSTAYLISLFVNFFLGVSAGVNVVAARYFGARDERGVYETVHTAMLLAVLCGLFMACLGIPLSRGLLELTSTPADVLDQATRYMQIYLLGVPFTLLFNFGAAILKAVGDTKRPLYYLTFAGCVNVPLNIFFVVVFGMDASGVAAATVISQAVSAALVFRCLVKTEGSYRLRPREIRLYAEKVKTLFKIGVPAGLQGTLFSISNIMIQSSVNSFGSIVMAGSTAAGNIGTFIFLACNSVYQAALSFTSQNVGAGKFERLDRILYTCFAIVSAIGITLGLAVAVFGDPLLSIFSADPEVRRYGMMRIWCVTPLYFTCGIMDVLVGTIRGLGKSIVPMIVTLLGVCGSRILWIYTVFAVWPTFVVLFISYPVSWVITAIAHYISYIIFKRELIARAASAEA